MVRPGVFFFIPGRKVLVGLPAPPDGREWEPLRGE
jgi:hypothetical protein